MLALKLTRLLTKIYCRAFQTRQVDLNITCRPKQCDHLHLFKSLNLIPHYSEVIMSATASQITSLTIVYPTVCSGSDQRNHQSSASLAFVKGNHRSPVNSPHKGPVTWKMFPFYDVIMNFNIPVPLITTAGIDAAGKTKHTINILLPVNNLWAIIGQRRYL